MAFGPGSLLNTTRTIFVSAMRADTPMSFSFLRRAGFSALFLIAGVEGGLGAQDLATLRVEENLRAEPQGVVLGRVPAGASFRVTEVRDRWVRVQVEGWMWTRSLQATDRLGFDLTVSASPEENLRNGPQGDIIGRLVEGTLLERLEDVPGWTRVRRVAWLWGTSVSVALSEPEEPGPAPSPQVGVREEGREESWLRSGPGGTPLLSGPDGDTLALAEPGAELQVLARDGNWVRVRLDGWAWAPRAEQPDSVRSPTILDMTPEQVSRDPEAFLGRVVVWELQFVSLERAERLRTDFFEGEYFLLTRSLMSGNAFVYVAISPQRLDEVEGLIPLERIRVVGRIRTGAAALTGNPILDLVELTRISRD